MKKQQLIKLILAILFSTLSTISFATNYYASPTGTGVGTFADPGTFAGGYAVITTPGDTLYLMGGVYNFSAKTSIDRVGTETARICIMAYPGESPICDFSAEPYGSSYPGFSVSSGSNYLHIKGLTVRYAGDNGIVHQGNNSIIENCIFYGNCDTGLQLKTGGGNLVLNCDSYGNFDYQTGGLISRDFGGNADGFADKQYTNMNPNIYDGCRAWNNSDDGWDFYQRVGDNTIKNSVCYKNGPATYNMTNHPRTTTDAGWFANFTPTELANYINYGNGNGFKLGGDYTASDVTVTNCLAVGNMVRGFDQNNNYGTMTLYNCSAYDNGTKNFGFGNNTGGALVIKNSVSLNGTNDLNTQTVTNSNNSWNTAGVSCDAADFISLDSTVILSPRQTDGSLPNIVFMQIADGSDLIDAGVELGLPYSGTAPDLGCYEKGSLDQYPGAVTSPTNKSQGIIEGAAIIDIVYTWSAGATGLTASGLPTGITATSNDIAKTLTLSGTPTEIGIFDYTITTVGGSGSPSTVDGRLTISSASAKKIAYVTTPNSPADALILNKLQANVNFSVSIEDAASINNYSTYDLIVMSPVPNSGSVGLPSIEGLDIPILLMKPFQLKDSGWDWGVAANTSEASITVTNPSHEIFTSITLGAGNELVLFNTVDQNGVTVITSWTNTPTLTEIATPVTAAGQCIIEVPIGTDMDGVTTTTQRLIMMGISEYSTASLTVDALQVIENTCYYLMGMPIPTNNPKVYNTNFSYKQNDTELIITNTETISNINVFNISGARITTISNSNSINIEDLTQGVYIAYICNTDNKCATIKFIK